VPSRCSASDRTRLVSATQTAPSPTAIASRVSGRTPSLIVLTSDPDVGSIRRTVPSNAATQTAPSPSGALRVKRPVARDRLSYDARPDGCV
jgi:hypothetical protein